MTVRLSTGTRNGLAGNLAFAELFKGGTIQIYSGTQPVTADAAVTGTLLGTVSLASATPGNETVATGTITITGTSGTITSVTVGGFNIIPNDTVPWDATATQTAADLAAVINRNGYYTATSSGAVVTLSPKPGAGAAHNGYAIVCTGITSTVVAMASGANGVNGLTFAPSSSGAVSKSGTWSFNGAVAGTAGWFRLVGAAYDNGTLQVGPTWAPRLDGAIGTSGSDLNLSNITIAVGAANTIDSFTFTIPSQ